MDWKTMLAYVTGLVDENLLLRIEYLVTENRILRDQIKGHVQLSDAERQALAEIGAKLGKQALADYVICLADRNRSHLCIGAIGEPCLTPPNRDLQTDGFSGGTGHHTGDAWTAPGALWHLGNSL